MQIRASSAPRTSKSLIKVALFGDGQNRRPREGGFAGFAHEAYVARPPGLVAASEPSESLGREIFVSPAM